MLNIDIIVLWFNFFARQQFYSMKKQQKRRLLRTYLKYPRRFLLQTADEYAACVNRRYK